MANETTELGHAPQPEVAKPDVNKEEKHLSSKPVHVLTVDEEKSLDVIRDTTVAIPVSAALKRLLGKRTPSQNKRGGKGDGRVYTLQTMPPRLFRPIGRSASVFRIPQEVLLSGSFTTSTSGPTFMAYYFTVNTLDQISALQSLFDQYRIVLVEFWLCPEVLAPTATNNVATVIDYDDATALGTYAQALDYVNCQSAPGTAAHYRSFVPHAALAAYSGTFVSYANVASPWIDAASPTVQHYGVKVAATLEPTTAISYDVTYRLTTEWRNVR
jgi:hypothetical protein